MIDAPEYPILDTFFKNQIYEKWSSGEWLSTSQRVFLIKGSYESISLKSHVLYCKYLSDSDTDGNWIYAQDGWCFGLSEQSSVDPYLTSCFKFIPYGYKCKKWKHKNTKRKNGRKVFYNLLVHKEYKKLNQRINKWHLYTWKRCSNSSIKEKETIYTEEYIDPVF